MLSIFLRNLVDVSFQHELGPVSVDQTDNLILPRNFLFASGLTIAKTNFTFPIQNCDHQFALVIQNAQPKLLNKQQKHKKNEILDPDSGSFMLAVLMACVVGFSGLHGSE